MGAISRIRHTHWFMDYSDCGRSYVVLQVAKPEPEFKGNGFTKDDAITQALIARANWVWANNASAGWPA